MSLICDITSRLDGFTLRASFEAQRGITVLFGPSGSGKTTLIKAVSGLMRPDAGRITLDDKVLFDRVAGVSLPAHRRGAGYVFQDARLFPHLSVEQNLTFAARADRTELPRITALLGLETLLARRPGTLSGGEAQRVALGRALLSKPKMLLADEPLAALDGPRKAELLPYFERLRDASDIPILYVTHSVSELARLADQVITLERGTASAPKAPAEVLADPKLVPEGVAGVGTLIEAKVAQHHPDGLTELDAGGAKLFVPALGAGVGADVRLRISASDVILSRDAPQGLSALNILPCTTISIRTGSGPGALVALQSPAGRLQARITRRSAAALKLTKGTQLYAIVKSVSIAREDVGG